MNSYFRNIDLGTISPPNLQKVSECIRSLYNFFKISVTLLGQSKILKYFSNCSPCINQNCRFLEALLGR